MTDKRISDHEKRRILEFLAYGYSLAQVARIMRRSTRSVWEIKQGASSTVRTLTQLNQAEADAPRTWDQLDDLGKRCLESFPLFATTFFCLRTPFWWAMAAGQLVKDVANVEEMFTLLHAPTGSGKTAMLEVLTLWLMSGGGTCDPEQGRALRFLFGSSTLPKAIRSVDRLRRIIEDPRPYFDPRQRRGAEHSLLQVYGQYKPGGNHDPGVWQQSQFMIASIGDHPLGQRDPTVSAYSVGW